MSLPDRVTTDNESDHPFFDGEYCKTASECDFLPLNGEAHSAPAKPNVTRQPLPPFNNGHMKQGSSIVANVVKVDKIAKPALMESIVENIRSATDNWPARMGKLLFSPRLDGAGVEWHENAASLFGWIGTATEQTPHFTTGAGYHPKTEVFERLRQTAREFQGVELFPHEPKMPGFYYACPDYEPGNGDRLTQLVAMFNPATNIDRDLIVALIVTVFWGEYGATRPLFSVTSDEGRGVGKTTLIEMVGYLAGGNFSFSLNEGIESVKQRLLTSEFLTTRVALIDNAKSNRVSNADYEALITARTISGKKMYVGEAWRPNNLVWAITLNGASFSTDIAQRAVVIKLKKPVYSDTWETGVRKFIDDHRDALISDCIGFLRRKPATITDPDRWGPWCCQIVARLPEPNDTLKVIRERRATTDSERSEVNEVEDDFAAKLAELSYDPEKDKIFIPSKMACQWCRDARNERNETNNATGRWLTQQITEDAAKCLNLSPGRTHGRGYIWIGSQWNGSDDMKVNLSAQIAAIEDSKRQSWPKS
jgi:rRNA maturation endonuclease Nob1